MSKPLLTISKLENVKEARIPGFFVAITAPINVEGDKLPAHRQQVPHSHQTTTQREEEHLHLIADLLSQKVLQLSKNKHDFVEFIISTHGFSNSKAATKQRIEEIYEYLNKDYKKALIYRSKNLMYIGYRWPSEPLMGSGTWLGEKLYNAIAALPILARTILIFGSIGILTSLFFQPEKLLVSTFLSLIVSGFGGFLDSLDQGNRTSSLDYLAQECRQKKIQVILSPERYEVDILGCDRDQVRKDMLNA